MLTFSLNYQLDLNSVDRFLDEYLSNGYPLDNIGVAFERMLPKEYWGNYLDNRNVFKAAEFQARRESRMKDTYYYDDENYMSILDDIAVTRQQEFEEGLLNKIDLPKAIEDLANIAHKIDLCTRSKSGIKSAYRDFSDSKMLHVHLFGLQPPLDSYLQESLPESMELTCRYSCYGEEPIAWEESGFNIIFFFKELLEGTFPANTPQNKQKTIERLNTETIEISHELNYLQKFEYLKPRKFEKLGLYNRLDYVEYKAKKNIRHLCALWYAHYYENFYGEELPRFGGYVSARNKLKIIRKILDENGNKGNLVDDFLNILFNTGYDIIVVLHHAWDKLWQMQIHNDYDDDKFYRNCGCYYCMAYPYTFKINRDDLIHSAKYTPKKYDEKFFHSDNPDKTLKDVEKAVAWKKQQAAEERERQERRQKYREDALRRADESAKNQQKWQLEVERQRVIMEEIEQGLRPRPPIPILMNSGKQKYEVFKAPREAKKFSANLTLDQYGNFTGGFM
jgi:hypothetical protein